MKTIEKAKAYDEALGRAKGLVDFCSDNELKTLKFVFPELKESEDERIRKEILDYVDKATGCQRWVAWLEKQCNTNIFDVPKISIKNAVEVTSRMQYIDDDIKPIAEFIMDYANWNLHKDEWNKPTLTVPLFRVLDALIQKGKPYCVCNQNIEKQGEQKPVDKVEPKFKVGDWCIDNEDGTIFQIVKVLDNTYKYRINEGKEYSCTHYSLELDARLWTISDAKDGDVLAVTMYPEGTWIGIFKEQNGCTFSTYCFLNTVGTFKRGTYSHGNGKSIHPATKEQRDKFEKAMADAGYVFDFEKKELKEIENEEYDGEDYGIDELWHAKNILEKTLGAVEGYQTDDGILDHKCAISFIDKLYKQKPAEWSEEDESNFQGIIDVIKENKHHETDYEHMTYYKLLSWFKSLKERYVWKPSDEQIDALEHFVRSIGESGFASPYDDNTRLLYSLLEQLKKL